MVRLRPLAASPRESTMSDMSTGPTDPNPTAPYDPSPNPPAPVVGPASGTSPVPSPTPPPMAPPPSVRYRRDDPGRTGTIVFGAILVILGLWFFADQTLGLELPRLRWSELWPVLLIGLGAWIVLGSMRRDR
jgi:hypothetical protein